MTRRSYVSRIPLVATLADAFAALGRWRVGRVPLGLIALVPVAIFIDLFDVGDELVGGPIGMGLSFILESAFLLALTGKPTYAFAFAGVDLIPFIDVIPFASITLTREIVRAWQTPTEDATLPKGPIIDV